MHIVLLDSKGSWTVELVFKSVQQADCHWSWVTTDGEPIRRHRSCR